MAIVHSDVNVYRRVRRYGGFHEWGYLPNGWFIRETPTEMDDFWCIPILGNHHICLTVNLTFLLACSKDSKQKKEEQL